MLPQDVPPAPRHFVHYLLELIHPLQSALEVAGDHQVQSQLDLLLVEHFAGEGFFALEIGHIVQQFEDFFVVGHGWEFGFWL